ncbi:DUF805 domain-containing protein [Aurantiacibacter gilvus]|uniref:DUF805 domain-containing protein n=1 Tax=Aurantiacibacter gilvus TaxID=3139141 RepID=A0ABU9ICZ4_9SPHN
MINETKYCLKNVTNFEGRDARQTFWFYVLFLVLLQFAIGLLSAIPSMASAFGSSLEAAQSGMDMERVQARMMAEMANSLGTMMWIGVATSAIITLLFVAAFVRRLHDAGYSGWLALVPVVIQVMAIYGQIDQADQLQQIFTSGASPQQMQAMQMEVSSNPVNYISWLGYLFVIVFGVFKSQPGPNRYGEPPQPL